MRASVWCAYLWILVFGVVLQPGVATAQGGCRVLDPELQGNYIGPCSPDGLAEGVGVARGRAEYVGDFLAGRKHGRGIKTWPWGDRYVGEFRQDARHGMGLYVWGLQTPNAGDSYQGEYLNDRRHGRGSYLWASGERYDGQFEADQMRGPPTAMAQQRGRYFKALQESVMKPGVIVCREVAQGIGSKERIRGVVTRADPVAITLTVKLDKDLPFAVNGQSILAGQELLDNPMLWEPCQ